MNPASSVMILSKKVHKARSRFNRDGLGRLLLPLFKRIGVAPVPARRLVTLAKVARRPVEFLQRLAGASRLKQHARWRMLAGKAYLRLEAHALEGIPELVAHCRRLIESKHEILARTARPPFTNVIDFASGPYGPVVLNPQELEPIVAFGCRRDVVAIVADHMGEVPVLGNVAIMYTPVNEEMLGSQLFHRDMDCVGQVGLFIALDEIGEENGPFMFLPAGRSAEVARALHHTGGRVSDDEFFSFARSDEVVKFTGSVGDMLFVNAYKCFHCGGRSRRRKRMMLQLRYTSLYCNAEPQEALYRTSNRAVFNNGDKLRRLLLDL